MMCLLMGRCGFCFDSILVRLKVTLKCSIIIILAGFDSILVRLKGGVASYTLTIDGGFDSILVRLKVNPFSISYDIPTGVSIPYWFD